MRAPLLLLVVVGLGVAGAAIYLNASSQVPTVPAHPASTTYVLIPIGASENRTLPSGSGSLSGQGYEPDVVRVVIGVNNTVVWLNEDRGSFLGVTISIPHSVTNPEGVFNSGLLNTGGTFTHVFTVPGSYYYHCVYHPWQKGTVVVMAP